MAGATIPPVPNTTTVSAAPDLGTQLTTILKQIQAVPATSISVNTDIGAVANCITEFLKFAQTPAGQQFVADVRTGTNQLNANIAKVGAWFEGLFK